MKLDLKVLTVAGAALLALAGVFLWRELQMPAAAVLAVAAVLAAGLAQARIPRARPIAGPIALLGVSVGGALWYFTRFDPLLLWGLGVAVLASAFTVYRMHRPARDAEDRLQLALLWYGVTVSALFASAAFYFQFLTIGYAHDEIARRLVLSIVWLAVGLVLVFNGHQRRERVIRDAGFGFVGAALLKVVLYDTTHLHGTLRIAGLAAAGMLLLLGAWVTSRRTAAVGRPE
ncbi:MAG: DUF2339 domain-containing protein [Myxococcaceae bacterium]